MSSIHNHGKMPPALVPMPPAPAAGAAAPSTAKARADEHHDAGHSTADAIKHAIHKTEAGVHTTEKVVHSVQQAAKGLAHEREVLAVLKQIQQVTPNGVRSLAHLAEAAAMVGESGVIAKAPSTGPALEQQAALKTLARYHTESKQAAQLARKQSQAAKNLNQAIKAGAPAEELANKRTLLAHVTKAATQAYGRLQKTAADAKEARTLLRALNSDTAAQVRRRASGAGYLWDYIQKSPTSALAKTLMHNAGNSKTFAAVAHFAHSKPVQFTGHALTGLAVGIDAYDAWRGDKPLASNITRSATQSAASYVMYTQAPLLPAVAAEALLMKQPHLTGSVRTVPQLLGIAVDYATQGSDVGDKGVAMLDQEMKSGRYGAVIKAANLVGQEMADRGVGDVLKSTVHYWSNVSAAKAWKDAKEAWAWARQ